jgi:hypothetical protein
MNLLLLLLSFVFSSNSSENRELLITVNLNESIDFTITNENDTWIEYFIINSDTINQKYSFKTELKFSYSMHVESMKVLIVSSAESEIKLKGINRDESKEEINIEAKKIINLVK